MLYEVYGDSGVYVYSDPKSERPSTSKTIANIKKVCQLIYSDHQLTVCIMADEPEIAKETV